MNQFGGIWTDIKIEILVEYAKAYLVIMNKYKNKYKPWKLLYFDGFAGTGFIVKDTAVDTAITIGAARRIIEIDHPISFDEYYFVEKDPAKVQQLTDNTKNAFPHKIIHIQEEDCNKKLQAMASFLNTPIGKAYKILAYIDPCGMQVEWQSIKNLANQAVDMWVLVPTGMGVNRLLKKDGKISDAWVSRLEKFLGMTRQEIETHFYKKEQTLFEDVVLVKKSKAAIEKSAELYKKRLGEVFKYVSDPFILKNSSNSIMYHLFLASNNKTAISIGNDIVKKYSN